MTDQHNLFVALRDAFPADRDSIAIETGDGERLAYTWRDLDRATAMLANLLDSLELPEGSRIAVQTEKSVEALMLYLAVLRAGYVYLPLNNAYQSAEIEYFIECCNRRQPPELCPPRESADAVRLMLLLLEARSRSGRKMICRV